MNRTEIFAHWLSGYIEGKHGLTSEQLTVLSNRLQEAISEPPIEVNIIGNVDIQQKFNDIMKPINVEIERNIQKLIADSNKDCK